MDTSGACPGAGPGKQPARLVEGDVDYALIRQLIVEHIDDYPEPASKHPPSGAAARHPLPCRCSRPQPCSDTSIISPRFRDRCRPPSCARQTHPSRRCSALQLATSRRRPCIQQPRCRPGRPGYIQAATHQAPGHPAPKPPGFLSSSEQAGEGGRAQCATTTRQCTPGLDTF